MKRMFTPVPLSKLGNVFYRVRTQLLIPAPRTVIFSDALYSAFAWNAASGAVITII